MSPENAFDKLIDRIYGETDFGRSVAMFVAGIAALVAYLSLGDTVVAALIGVIVFPIVRLVSTWLYEKARRTASRKIQLEEAANAYDELCIEERDVVAAFVRAGGSVLLWSEANSLSLSHTAIESLIQRGILNTSVTADGMRETFVLDTAMFVTVNRLASK